MFDRAYIDTLSVHPREAHEFCINMLFLLFSKAFYKLSQISQLSMLHAANQPTVPEATPVPGYERQTFPMHLTSQDIASGRKHKL